MGLSPPMAVIQVIFESDNAHDDFSGLTPEMKAWAIEAGAAMRRTMDGEHTEESNAQHVAFCEDLLPELKRRMEECPSVGKALFYAVGRRPEQIT